MHFYYSLFEAQVLVYNPLPMTPTHTMVCNPTVYDGHVQFGRGDHFLYAHDPKTVEERWKFETQDMVCNPTVYDGRVYFENGNTVAFNSGAKTPATVSNSPRSAPDAFELFPHTGPHHVVGGGEDAADHVEDVVVARPVAA